MKRVESQCDEGDCYESDGGEKRGENIIQDLFSLKCVQYISIIYLSLRLFYYDSETVW